MLNVIFLSIIYFQTPILVCNGMCICAELVIIITCRGIGYQMGDWTSGSLQGIP